MSSNQELVGKMLAGRFRIEKKLGQGGIGVVYLARDAALHNKPVVIKTLLPQVASKQGREVELFKREIEALARISHPGVAQIIDRGKFDGGPFFAMEFIKGKDLSRILATETLALSRVAQLIQQIGYALNAAHEEGVIHRDLKPANVMIVNLSDHREHIKLIDFGVAKIAASVTPDTEIGLGNPGTPVYMSPEQLIGKQVTPGSDVYSMGVIAYELLTRRLPFQPPTTDWNAYVIQLSLLQKAGVAGIPADACPELPEAGQALILSALSHDPDKRPASAREFGEAFLECVEKTNRSAVVFHPPASPSFAQATTKLAEARVETHEQPATYKENPFPAVLGKPSSPPNFHQNLESGTEFSKRILQYWRNALADAERMGVNQDKVEPGLRISHAEIASGMVNAAITKDIFQRNEANRAPKALKRPQNKANPEVDEEEDAEHAVGLLLCPVKANLKTHHAQRNAWFEKTITPVWVPGVLVKVFDDEGTLMFGKLKPHPTLVPWLSRNLLEPNAKKSFVVGSVADVDDFLSRPENEVPTPDRPWHEVWNFAGKMFIEVTARAGTPMRLDGFEHPDYETDNEGYRSPRAHIVLESSVQGAAQNILRTYDYLLRKPEVLPPLARRFTSARDEKPVPFLSTDARSAASRRHLGQMTAEYPLSPSQRESLHHILNMTDGEILAVTGPPGTGKTTLLQAVVATLWVERALEQVEPLLIVAASTNNQAVTNVIDSFGKIRGTDSLFDRRWLPDIKSFGLYCPAESNSADARGRGYQVAGISGQHFPAEIEDGEYLSRAKKMFLEKCAAHANRPIADVENAGACLHSELEAIVGTIRSGLDLTDQLNQIHVHIQRTYAVFGGLSAHFRELTAQASNVQAGINRIVALQRQQVERPSANRWKHFAAELADADSLTDLLNQNGTCSSVVLETLERLQAEESRLEHEIHCQAEDLRTETRRYEHAQTMRKDWIEFSQAEPLLMAFLRFLPPIRNRLRLRNLAFFRSRNAEPPIDPTNSREVEEFLDRQAAEIDHRRATTARLLAQLQETFASIEKQGSQAVSLFLENGFTTLATRRNVLAVEISQTERDQARLDRVEREWTTWRESTGFPANGDLESFLDTTLRAKAFWTATHYWEARWVSDAKKRLAEAARNKELFLADQTKKWRRYAKLTPCVVSTFHSLPKFMTALDRFQGDFLPIPNFIDLLIVDEAGQVSPEVAAASFALSKRALVVGDLLQIPPVWNLPRPIDIGNLESHGLVSSRDEEGLERFFQTGLGVSGDENEPHASGNVMRIAQRATKYRSPDYSEPGMFLCEHRRCVDEIIAYCNDLAYQGRLCPLRGCIDNHPLPHLGYAAIPSESEKRGGSRVNFPEAQTISAWIVENRGDLEKHYAKPIREILGVVTPFRRQSTLIEWELQRKGLSGISIGTIHRFQGAERDIIIFSPVYGPNDKGSYFFDRSLNMLNVAVSRAKDSFLVFGTIGIFDPSSASPSGKLAKHLFARITNRIEITGLSGK